MEGFKPLANAKFGVKELMQRHKGATGAIVGTGTSLTDFDVEMVKKRDVEVTIGVNEAVKLFTPNFLVLRDEGAVPKMYKNIHPSTTVVMACRTMRWIVTAETEEQDLIIEKFSGLENLYYADFESEVDDPQTTLFYRLGIATAAFSLAHCLEISRCYLYGFDFYALEKTHYAAGVNIPPHDDKWEIPGKAGFFTTEPLNIMCQSIEDHRHMWGGVEFINMSRHSQLRCFPVDPVESLPKEKLSHGG